MRLKNISTMPKIKIKWRDLFFVLIGSLFGTLMNNWSYFTFSSEISLTDSFTAILGGYLGLYIGGKLTSQNSSERIEKDLMIQEISVVNISLSRLYPNFSSNTLTMNEAVAFFKQASQSFNNVSTIANMCEDKPKIVNLSEALFRDTRTLNNMVTNHGTNLQGVIQIPSTQVQLVKEKSKQLRDNAIRLIIAINRM